MLAEPFLGSLPTAPCPGAKSSGRCARRAFSLPRIHTLPMPTLSRPDKARHSAAKNGAVERKGSSGHSALCPEQPHCAQLLSALGPPERNNRLTRNNLSEQVFWKSSPHEVQPYGQPLNERPDHKHGLRRLGIMERGAGPGPGAGTGTGEA